jgi:hypothetical protein
MKIEGLNDWLNFVDEIVAPAEQLLRDTGICEEEWPELIAQEFQAYADRRKDKTGGENGDRIGSALTALNLRQETYNVARQVAYRPDAAAACLSALAWKLQQVVAVLPSGQLVRNSHQTRKPAGKPPTFLQTRALLAILSGGYRVQTADEILALLTEGRLELRTHDIDVWRDELAEKLIFLDVASEEMDVIDESALDDALTEARKCLQS